MLCEAVAQVGIVFFHLSRPIKGDVTYLLGSIKMRFLEPAWPGDQLEIEVTPIKVTATAGILAGEVRVRGRVIARAEFALSAKDNSRL
jgi:3-hydroxymyristoyl/3-hydroxydecanoyl-(acyl carrier protein) dehydratase